MLLLGERARRASGKGTAGGVQRGDGSRTGTEAKLYQCAGVGDELGLPAIVGLHFLHGGFRCGVPMTAGLAGEVAGLDKGCLNLGGAFIVDGTLAGELFWLGGVFGDCFVRCGRSPAGAGSGGGGNRQREGDQCENSELTEPHRGEQPHTDFDGISTGQDCRVDYPSI